MHLPVNHQTLMGNFEDESEELHHARMADSGSGEGSGEGSPVSSRGNGGCIRDRPVKVIPCPRCQSMNTKFCYYNNYSVNQPRHFCRNCQRYWTVGGTLRNVPVGGGSRKKTRTRSRNDTYLQSGAPQTSPVGSLSGSGDGLLSVSNCMQQLSMLPPTPGMLGFNHQLAGFAPGGTQLPFLQFALEQNHGLFPAMQQKPALAGLQEVPDLQSLYDAPQVPQVSHVNSALLSSSTPSMMNSGFFLPDLGTGGSGSHSDALASVMAKAGLWSTPAPHGQPLGGVQTAWDDRPAKRDSISAQLQHLNGYDGGRIPLNQVNATVLPQNLKTGFWETALMHGRPLMDDRLVPHASWDEAHTNLSPNASSSTEEERCPPRNCFSHGYEDVGSQSWVGLQASDILFH